MNTKSALTLTALCLAGLPAADAEIIGSWNADAAGSWSTATNWTSNPDIPGTNLTGGDSASLNFNITLARTITLDGERHLGSLTIGDPNSSHAYTLNGGANGRINFNTGAASAARLNFTSNLATTISAPITLTSNLRAMDTGAGNVARTLSGVISGPGAITFDNDDGITPVDPVSQWGQFTLSVANSFSGGITIKDVRVGTGIASGFGTGTVKVLPGGTAHVTGTTTVSNDMALTGLGWPEALGNLAALRLASGCTAGGTITITGIAGDSAGTTPDASLGTFAIGAGAVSGTFNGVVTGGDLLAGTFAPGATGFTGNDTIILNNANTYGDTIVSGYSLPPSGQTTLSIGGATTNTAATLGTGNVYLHGGSAGRTTALRIWRGGGYTLTQDIITKTGPTLKTAFLADVVDTGLTTNGRSITVTEQIRLGSNANGAVLNIDAGTQISAGQVFTGNAASNSTVVNQTGGTVTVSGEVRVANLGTETSVWNLSNGSLTLTGLPTANPFGNLQNEATAGKGTLYVGVDGQGIFNQTGGTVNAAAVVLDNRTNTVSGTNMTSGIDTYTLAGGVLNLGSDVSNGNWGVSGNASSSFAFAGGTLNLGTSLPISVPVAVTGTSSVLDTKGFTATLSGPLSGGGLLELADSTSSTGSVTLNLAAASAVGGFSGNVPLQKLGTGTLTITGNGTYSGNAVINEGTLLVTNTSGSGTGTGNVTVNPTGTLGGTGSVAGTVTISGGSLAPGVNGVGTLTIGRLNLGGTVAFDIGGSGVNAALMVTDFTLTANSVFTFTPIGGVSSGGSYTLLTSANPITTNGFTITGQAIGKLSFNPTIHANTVTITPSLNEGGWNQTGGGNWNTGGNWTNYQPTLVGDAALFGSSISGPATVTVDSPQSVGFLRFDNALAYTIGANGSSNLTLDNGAASAIVVVTSGSHVIAENVALASNLMVVPLTGTTLTVSGDISGPGKAVQLNDAGTLVLSGAGNSHTGTTSVNAGTLSLTGSLIGGGAITVSGSGVLAESATGVIGGASTLTHSSSRTSTLAGPNAFTGVIIVSGGELDLTNWSSSTLGAITVTGTSGAILGIAGSATYNLGANSIFVGSSSAGTVNQTGGTVTFASSNACLVGNGAGGVGTYNLSAGNLTSFASAARGVIIGVNNSCSGTFRLSGTGNLDLSVAELAVGRNDAAVTGCTAAFYQTGGTATFAYLSIGGQSGSTGTTATFSVTGGSFTGTAASSFQNLAAAATSSATMTLGGGAQVTLPAFPTATRAGTANLTLDFTTGFLSPAAASTAYMSGLTNAYLTANGANFNVPTGKDITVAQAFQNAPTQQGTLTKSGVGTLTLTGLNTYTGNTTVNGGTLALADNAQLKFVLGAASGINNIISGAGTVTLAGDFVIDTSAADGLASGTWTLENVSTLTGPYGATFSVVGFTDAGSDKWTKTVSGKKYTFDETTGILTLGTADAYAPWAALKGLDDSDAAHSSAKNTDPDGDGKNNLYEFALDGNPLAGANDGKVVGKIATVSAAQVMTLTLPVRTGATFSVSSGDQLSALIDGIYYRVEGDEALSPFADAITEVPAGADLTAIQAGLPALSSGWTYRTFRAPGTAPTVPKAFLRAKISETP